MFDRFVRLAQARRALREGRFEEALRLADDPIVREHRRAEDVRTGVVRGLVKRAAQRQDAGATSAARMDLARALAIRPEHADALAVRAGLKAASEATEDRRESRTALVRDAHRALDGADLRQARELCDAAARLGNCADLERLAGLLGSASRRVGELLEAHGRARDEGRVLDGVEALLAARSIDATHEGVARAATTAAKQCARGIAAALRAVRDVQGASAASELLGRIRTGLVELASSAPLVELTRELCGGLRETVFEALRADDCATARAALGPAGGDGPELEHLRQICERLERATDLAEHGELILAADMYRELAEEIGGDRLTIRESELRATAATVESRFDAARLAARDGRLADARRALLDVLTEVPCHRRAATELEVLNMSAEDRERRLQAARAEVREGRLRQAASTVLSVAIPGPEGDEPRLLAADIEQRIAVVEAGIHQVVSRLHDRTSGSREGLESALGRLGELAKVQSDSLELARVQAAIEAEISGLGHLVEARGALGGGANAALSRAMAALHALRMKLLTPDRLDARAAAVIDELLLTAERAVAAGAVVRGSGLLAVVGPWGEVVPGVERRREELARQADEARRIAGERLLAARAALDGSDLATAEAALEAARAVAADDPAVVRFAGEIARVRDEQGWLDEARRHAARRDFGAAHRELGQLGPTPPMLRTRVFDLRKEIARAQGLNGAFLLRVDEGGEFLVVRGESLTIGNLRDGSADLPMLANLAGRHARLRRSMSFHGGQQDRVVAEAGELSAAGVPASEIPLRERTRFRLGPTVEMEYRLPSPRSLSALLTVLGGFQVAGTDRVIWMKDRGRDGRILIGPGRDAHVLVPGAEVEIEVFADRDGRIQVRLPEAGELDGKPISGEYPASAGAALRCGGISLVMLPWQRS